MSGGQAYSDRIRLADQIADARRLLLGGGEPGEGRAVDWAAHCGHLEAMLQMVCDSAEAVLDAGDGK